MAVVLAGAQVDDHAHQLVEPLLHVLLGVVGADLKLVGKGDLPVELGDALLGLVVLEPSQVNAQKIWKGLDDRPLVGVDQVSALVALELVAAGQLLGLAVAPDAVVEGDVGLGQDETQVDLLLLALRNYLPQKVLFLQTEHSVRVTRFEKNSSSRGVTFFSLSFSWSLMQFISQM